MTAVMMKAQKNRPVLSTTKPVTTGAIHPARLPKKFCSPVHSQNFLGNLPGWIEVLQPGPLASADSPERRRQQKTYYRERWPADDAGSKRDPSPHLSDD